MPSNQQDIYAAFAYDAVYAIALALNKSETDLMKYNKTLQDFTYDDVQMAQIIRTNMQNLLFDGISVSFIHKCLEDQNSIRILQISFSDIIF